MPYDTFLALAATYSDVADAEADYEAVKAIYYDLQLIDTFDAAVIQKSADGKVKIVKKHEQPTRHGAWLGGGVGLAVGLVAAIFPPVAIGGAIVAGTSIGAGVGAIAGHVTGGMSRGDLKDLGEQLDAGEVALIAVAAADVADRVESALKKASKVSKKELKSDSKALDKDLDEAKKQSEAAPAKDAAKS
jgi:uncharacterized membrane protein